MKSAKKTISKNSVILWEGLSAIDSKPIVLILSGLKGSDNEKTGNMLQTYILRSDINPVEGAQNGADVSICGDCKHRPILAKKSGEAKCYVNLGQGALSVYKCYKKGNYAHASFEDIELLVKGKNVRFGTYGDPAVCPIFIFDEIAKHCKGFTGYTHQWMNPKFDQKWSKYLMASVDNIMEKFVADALGMRYFRVSIGVETPIKNEISCPASKEMGYKTTCNACLLCAGTSKKAKNIVIADHGIGWQTRAKNKANFDLYDVSHM